MSLRKTNGTSGNGQKTSRAILQDGDEVRMVQVGNPPFSTELCGGTHVHSTGEIGLLYIVSEESVGSGLRRIEAMTGRAAEHLVEERLSALDSLATQLQTVPESVEAKVASMADELDRERKRALNMERESARKAAGSLLSEACEVSGIKVISTTVAATSADPMREMGDRLKEELKSGVIVLGAVCDGKPNVLVMVTPDLVAKGFNAGQVAKEVAKVVAAPFAPEYRLRLGETPFCYKTPELPVFPSKMCSPFV